MTNAINPKKIRISRTGGKIARPDSTVAFVMDDRFHSQRNSIPCTTSTWKHMLNKGNLLDEMVFHRKFDLDASRLWIIFYKSIQCRPNSFDLALHLRVMVFRDGFEEDLCERVLHLFEALQTFHLVLKKARMNHPAVNSTGDGERHPRCVALETYPSASRMLQVTDDGPLLGPGLALLGTISEQSPQFAVLEMSG